jgi:hypothetical protein
MFSIKYRDKIKSAAGKLIAEVCQRHSLFSSRVEQCAGMKFLGCAKFILKIVTVFAIAPVCCKDEKNRTDFRLANSFLYNVKYWPSRNYINTRTE